MRAQAMILIFCIVFVVILTTFYALSKKNELYNVYNQMLELNKQSEDLTKSHIIVIEVLTDLLLLKQPIDEYGNFDTVLLKRIHENFLKLVEAKNVISEIMPQQMEDIDLLLKMLATMVMQPSGQLVTDVLAQSRITYKNLVNTLIELQDERGILAKKYLEISEHSAYVVLGVVIVICILILLVCLYFFNSLAKRIDTVVKQTQMLVENKDPVQLPIDKEDEIGQLISALNQVSLELERKGQQLAISRYSYFNEIRNSSVRHLVAGLIHELGNPIASLKGLLEQIEPIDINKQQDTIDLMKLQVEKLETFNSHLISFASERSIKGEAIILSQLVKQYIYFLNLDERWYSIDIEYYESNELPVIFASREQISILLNNICDNALAAIEKSNVCRKSLKFILKSNESHLILEISDNGIGMPPSLIDACFEPYITTQENANGAGFGLNVCQAVMEELGGNIQVNSEQGKGCSVILNFPKGDIADA